MYNMAAIFEPLGLDLHQPSASQLKLEESPKIVGSKDDPWLYMFPADPEKFVHWDESDLVQRCPKCHCEVEDAQCLGCGIEFSDNGEGDRDWDMSGVTADEDADGNSEDEGERPSGTALEPPTDQDLLGEGEDQERSLSQRAREWRPATVRSGAFAVDGTVVVDHQIYASPFNSLPPGEYRAGGYELVLQTRMRDIARERYEDEAEGPAREFHEYFMSPTTQRMAREELSAQDRSDRPERRWDDDQSSTPGTSTSDSEDDASRRRADRHRRSAGFNGQRSIERNHSQHRSRNRALGSGFIDDEAEDDESEDDVDESMVTEDSDGVDGYRPRSRALAAMASRRGDRNGNRNGDGYDSADSANINFNEMRHTANARTMGRSEHVGDEADSQEEGDEGENEYDLDDGFICDDDEVEEGSGIGSEIESESDDYEYGRKKVRLFSMVHCLAKRYERL